MTKITSKLNNKVKNQCIDELVASMRCNFQQNWNVRFPGSARKWKIHVIFSLSKTFELYYQFSFRLLRVIKLQSICNSLFTLVLNIRIKHNWQYSWAHSIYRERAGKLLDLFFLPNNLVVCLIEYANIMSHNSLNLLRVFHKNILMISFSKNNK